MKKLSILSIVFLTILTSMNLQAQDLRSKFSFGLKAGGNLANIYDKDAEQLSFESKIGFAGGVFATIPIGKFLAIQPEVMFSQKGFQSTGNLFGNQTKFSRTTNFLTIPVLLAVRPTSWLSIVVGPEVNFLLSKKDKFTMGNLSNEQKEEFEHKNLRKNIIGMNVGFDFNIHHFLISPRASIDFQDNKGDGTSTNPRYKNAVFQLTVGYRF